MKPDPTARAFSYVDIGSGFYKAAIFCYNVFKKHIFIVSIIALVLAEAQYGAGARRATWHGTYFSLKRTDDYVAVAIDSLRTNRAKPPNYDVCKIVALSKRLIFFNVGLAEQTDNIVNNVYLQVRQSQNLIVDLPEAYMTRMFNFISSNYGVIDFQGPIGSPIIGSYFVGVDINGMLQVVEVQIDRGPTAPIKIP
jgi:hypothetical protein